MTNFESLRSIENVDTEKAYSKAKEVLSKAINPLDFKEIYDDVESDMAYVTRLEKEFDERSKASLPEFQQVQKIATILEGIIIEAGELCEWFGENATTIIPSRYDDIKNGVDCILEFAESETDASHLALAIDVISGPEVESKLNRILRDIEEGHLSEIKYLESDYLEKGATLNDIPKVVIGADRKHVREVMELWLNNKKKDLAEHHLQYQILKEIKMQLVEFGKYARSINATAIAETYEKATITINGIMRQKSFGPDEMDIIETDEVYSALKAYLGQLNKKQAA